jgi:pSer/pThr/pTyr-binding forkhead associated (FHA) protein
MAQLKREETLTAMADNYTPANIFDEEITLTLLHPTQGTPIKRWPFKNVSLIRIGRAPDNELVLESPVVSRHHAELQFTGTHWEVSSLGTNGTFVDGKQVSKERLADGAVVRLALSGPQLECRICAEPLPGTECTTVEAPRTLPEISIDHHKKEREVAEVLASDYFQTLQAQAEKLRNEKKSEE